MSRMITKLPPDMRAGIVAGLTSIISSLPDDAQLDVNISRGLDDVTQPEEQFVQWAPNDTWTITLQVNGGAQERDRSGEMLMDFVRKLAAEDREYALPVDIDLRPPTYKRDLLPDRSRR